MQREKAPGAPVFRNEWKHLISPSDRAQLRTRLSAVAYQDPHAIDGRYKIRSLYFDTISDRVLREKIDGVSVREKFRIRYYNDDPSVIFLEKKCKQSGAGYKLQTRLTKEQANRIVKGDIDWMRESGDGLLVQLYSKMRVEGLRPKTIVDYTREPFIYPAGNVRVTIDYDIRSGLWETDFLDPHCLTIPAGNEIILEVKWDAYLPSIIRSAVQLTDTRTTAFSKYQVCRRFG